MKPNTMLAPIPILILMCAAPSAQRGGAVVNRALPVPTNAILKDPGAYQGKPITVSAGVERMLSKTAFLVDQWRAVGATEVKPIGAPILVIAPYLTRALDPRNYLLMSGQIVTFNVAEIARVAAGYAIDLPPGAGAAFEGRPVLVATSVIDSRYTELARKPLPPPGPEEVALTAAMKTIAPAFAALRTAAQEAKADVTALNAAKLAPAFTQAETSWDDLGQKAAAQWSREARAHAVSIEQAAATGRWEAVQASAGALGQLCQTCHAAYRERLEDGTFRIRPGSF